MTGILKDPQSLDDRGTDIATQIMTAMVRMPPELHKDAPKPLTTKGTAQRRRRENERHRDAEKTA
jgi:hypothetical protein